MPFASLHFCPAHRLLSLTPLRGGNYRREVTLYQALRYLDVNLLGLVMSFASPRYRSVRMTKGGTQDVGKFTTCARFYGDTVLFDDVKSYAALISDYCLTVNHFENRERLSCVDFLAYR